MKYERKICENPMHAETVVQKVNGRVVTFKAVELSRQVQEDRSDCEKCIGDGVE